MESLRGTCNAPNPNHNAYLPHVKTLSCIDWQIDMSIISVSLLEEINARLQLLEEFVREIADLTANHDGIHFYVTNEHERQIEQDVAVVYPSKLGKALEKVDKEWWKHTSVLPT